MQNINTWFVLQAPTDQELKWSLQIEDRKMRRKRMMMMKKKTTKIKTRTTQRVLITKRKRTKSMTFTSSFIK